MGTSAQTTRIVIMKVFLTFFTALLSTVFATTEVGCEDCKALVSTMGMYLSSEESIAKQVEILLAEFCPTYSDPQACVEGLPEFWEKVAMMLWPGYYNPDEEFMCMQEGLCGAPGSREAMTCDECLDGIKATIDQLLTEEFVSGIVAWLSGEEFCGMDEDPEMCANVIAELIPAALPTLAANFDPEGTKDLCNMAVADTCMA